MDQRPAGARNISRRRLLGGIAAAGALGPVALGALGGASGPAGAAEIAFAGRIPSAAWDARVTDYLSFAVGKGLSPNSVNSVIAFIEAHRRDPAGVPWDPGVVTPEGFADEFAKIYALTDTSDFNVNRLIQMLAGYSADLPTETVDAVAQCIIDSKFWWTDPTPPGKVDNQYYWTENHLIIFLANAYIAGQLWPATTFTNSGLTGAALRDRARPTIMQWLALRARFGWSEWLSNVYYNEDWMGLLILAEWADDPEVASLSAAVLDANWIELASHLQAGAFGATHGRSYMKDKMTGRTEDTFNTAKLVFDDTAFPYQSVDNASLFACSHRYRPPQVARLIATDAGAPATVEQRQSLPLDTRGPVVDAPPPYGLSYLDPVVWWSMGAQFAWPVVPLSIGLIETYNLWETTNFQQAIALKPIVESSTIPQLQDLAVSLASQVNAGLLTEINSYTWRAPEVMLSTAQDWRPGERSEQNHAWQATVDADAQVFTTHPYDGVPPAVGYDGDGGYWSGNGATPRCAQHRNVVISIYQPAFAADPSSPLSQMRYEPYTHGFFPTERFDEVVERPATAGGGTGGWTIGRKGDGYVALWSWRPTSWRAYSTDEYALGLTEPFELRAEGGANNVWICEVGRAADWPSFSAFADAIAAAPIEVLDLAGGAIPGPGFTVRYGSPSLPELRFGSSQPLSVGGTDVDLHPSDRWRTPWATVAWGDMVYTVRAGGETLVLDFTALIPYLPSEAFAQPAPAAPVTTVPAAPAAVPRFTG